MSSPIDDKALDQEVKFFAKNLDRREKVQREAREKLLKSNENAERLAIVRQRLVIAEQLYKARKKAGLTQAQLANKMKVSQPLVARLEKGDGNISCDTLLRYSSACGCRLRISFEPQNVATH